MPAGELYCCKRKFTAHPTAFFNVVITEKKCAGDKYDTPAFFRCARLLSTFRVWDLRGFATPKMTMLTICRWDFFAAVSTTRTMLFLRCSPYNILLRRRPPPSPPPTPRQPRAAHNPPVRIHSRPLSVLRSQLGLQPSQRHLHYDDEEACSGGSLSQPKPIIKSCRFPRFPFFLLLAGTRTTTTHETRSHRAIISSAMCDVCVRCVCVRRREGEALS